jgi:acyl-CoA thioester hydrolase
MEIRVYYEDTDISGNVYHSNYLNFCERARSELFFSKGISPILNNGHFVVSSLSAKFLKPANFGEVLKVETKVLEIKRVSLKLLQTIYRGNEKIFFVEITLAFLNGNKLAKLPNKIKDIFINF